MEGIRKKVSCHVITYNHINYISKCIDGILMQETNFDFEIIIGDDLSTDGTRELLQKYALQYPDLIRLNLRKERGTGIPGKDNFLSTLNMCNGEYISLCDGDDYWTDPHKLQKQVDFLEQNKEYVLCFHKVDILKPDGSIVDDFITVVPDNYEERKTLVSNANYIHVPSVVFKNVIQKHLNTIEFKNSPIGDYFLYIILSNYGKIGYLPEKMAVYRYGVGVYSSLDLFKMIQADILLFTNLYSFEKDESVKEIFYNNIKSCQKQLDHELNKAKYIARMFNTRRHKMVENLYRVIKKFYPK